ncbi:arsenate reductase [Pedobacter sp.]|uniref:arsenate reductase n=1 Tax=Pedobacter sp. TaxID=1411316 RepID=UPI003D7F1F30
MIIVFGIPNCGTVKKALTWLTDNGMAYEFHDFKKKGISAEKLNEWCSVFGWENVLNKKGTSWRKLTVEQQQAVKDQASAVLMLSQNTSAIKRPIIEKDGKAVLLSFNEAQYEVVLK